MSKISSIKSKTKIDIKEKSPGKIRKFFSKHENKLVIAFLISFIMSLLSLLINHLQFRISEYNKSEERKILAIQNEKDWNLKVVDFIISKYNFLYGKDAYEREKLLKMMSALFPTKITEQIYALFITEFPAEKVALEIARLKVLLAAEHHNAYVYLYYVTENQEEAALRLSNSLNKLGYYCNICRINKEYQPNKTFLKYFRSEDKEIADYLYTMLKTNISRLYIEHDKDVEKEISSNPKYRNGFLEIWLSKDFQTIDEVDLFKACYNFPLPSKPIYANYESLQRRAAKTARKLKDPRSPEW